MSRIPKAKSAIGPIQKGVPIPNLEKFRSKYPWQSMRVGDSFAVMGISTHKLGNAARVWVRYHDNGWKFAARTEGQGTRIWRIK